MLKDKEFEKLMDLNFQIVMRGVKEVIYKALSLNQKMYHGVLIRIIIRPYHRSSHFYSCVYSFISKLKPEVI